MLEQLAQDPADLEVVPPGVGGKQGETLLLPPLVLLLFPLLLSLRCKVAILPSFRRLDHPYLIIVTTLTTWGGVPFSSRRTFLHRERERDCFQES